MLKNINIGDELEDGLIIIDKCGGDNLTVKSKTGWVLFILYFKKILIKFWHLKHFKINLLMI